MSIFGPDGAAAAPPPPRPPPPRHCRRHRRRHRRRCHLHLLHLSPRPLSPSPWLLARRQASPAFPPRPLSPPAASVRAPCLPGPRQVRRWRRSRSPLRELPQDSGCLSRVAHMTLIRCSPLAGCGCVIELGSRKPGWRLTSRKIRSGRLPQFGSPPRPRAFLLLAVNRLSSSVTKRLVVSYVRVLSFLYLLTSQWCPPALGALTLSSR